MSNKNSNYQGANLYRADTYTKKIVYAGLLLAIALILPQAFHMLPVGINTGKVFLPMHLPVILAGFVVGPIFGMAVGITASTLSAVLFNMPTFIALPAMALELMTYGLLAGLLSKKIKNVYVVLAITLVGGRIVSGLMYVVLFNLFGMNMLNLQVFLGNLVMGIPGIVIQFAIIPILLRKLNVFK